MTWLRGLKPLILSGKTTTVYHDVIILGDINLHVDDCADYCAQKSLSLLQAFDRNQHVTDTTHVKSHILDLLITHIGCNSILTLFLLLNHYFVIGRERLGVITML